MANFENDAIIEFPVEQVFNIILEAATRDFPEFNKKNPIGAYVEKEVGSYSSKTGKMKIEITDFRENELYEITSSQDARVFKSKYSFEKISDNETKVILEESENANGFISGMNSLMVGFIFKKRIKRRFQYLIEGLRNELEKKKEEVTS